MQHRKQNGRGLYRIGSIMTSLTIYIISVTVVYILSEVLKYSYIIVVFRADFSDHLIGYYWSCDQTY